MPLDWLCACAECKQTSGLAGSCSIIVKPMGPFLSQGVNILSFVIGKKTVNRETMEQYQLKVYNEQWNSIQGKVYNEQWNNEQLFLRT